MKKILALGLLMTSVSSMANFKMLASGKKITCYNSDNSHVELNAERTTLKYVVDGESLGARRIKKTITNEITISSFSTSELSLILTTVGATYQLKGETVPKFADCKVESIF